jgi:hypothetical protein
MPTGYQEAERMSAELQKACVSLGAYLIMAALILAAALLSGGKASCSILAPLEDLNPLLT